MRDLAQLFTALQRSSFRARFRLSTDDQKYIARHGLETVLKHGRDFISQRLAPAQISNDGRQTPLRGHPIFVAQHATATCCRKCLAKWHSIERGSALTNDEIEYMLTVLEYWLKRQAQCANPHSAEPHQRTLFRAKL